MLALLRTLYRDMMASACRSFPRAPGRAALPHAWCSLLETSWFGFCGFQVLEPMTRSNHPAPPCLFQRSLLLSAQSQGLRHLGRDPPRAKTSQLILATGYPDALPQWGSRRICWLYLGNITFKRENTGLLSDRVQITGTVGHKVWLHSMKAEGARPRVSKTWAWPGLLVPQGASPVELAP